MLSANRLGVIMLSVVMLSVVMLNVTEPFRHKECRIGTSPTLIILYTKSFSAALHSTSQRAIYTSDFIVRFCGLVRLKHNPKIHSSFYLSQLFAKYSLMKEPK